MAFFFFFSQFTFLNSYLDFFSLFLFELFFPITILYFYIPLLFSLLHPFFLYRCLILDFFKNFRWPLILDPDGRALQWLRSLYKDRTVTILQELGQTEDLMATIEKSVSDGDILIMYDDACTFDSRLDVLYRRCFVKSEAEDGNEDVLIEVI